MQRAGWRTELYDPRRATDYDVVVFVKGYTDDDIALAQRLRAAGVTTVFDLCDNHFFNPDGDPVLAERAERLERMLAVVDAATSSTAWLADRIPHRTVVVVDDPVDTSVRPRGGAGGRRIRLPGRARRTRVAWFGTAGSPTPRFGMVDLNAIGPELERVNSRLPIELSVMSDSRAAYRRWVAPLGVPSRYRTWRERSFARHLGAADVCVLPITLTDFTAAKSANRVITSLMVGVPVVASRVPSYEDLAEFVLFDDWADNIAAYATDPELARRHVEAGREHITSKYTAQHLLDQWAAAFDAARAVAT